VGRRVIGILILLAILSVAGIIATQIYWLDKAFKVQQTQIDLRKDQAQAEAKIFNDRVTIALTNVTNQILTITNDPAELFQSVKQIRPNYFTVAINDTLNPYLLETLLRSEFERRNIGENFEYGIYDCFTDSIVYGDYVALTEDSNKTDYSGEAPQVKWDKDGHYFGVFFPDRVPFEIEETKPQVSTWAFSAIITLIVFCFFAYAIYLILKQKKLSEMKTDFINNMTHELKTPISTISLSSEVLMNPKIQEQPDRLNRYATLIYNENQRLRMQVDKVLQLATIDKESANLKFTDIDLHELIKQTTEAISLVQSENGMKISLNLKATNPWISGDKVHITNVINNLIDNAQKYSGDHPQITVSTRSQSGKILFMVADNGIGIPQKSLPYIFDKFYRVPTGNRHDVKGFGLGLFYVKQMVNAHNGDINATSELGSGTTFTIEFPNIKTDGKS
jgi:two-component system phosphate regulon sensor histidine kinase PhoR